MPTVRLAETLEFDPSPYWVLTRGLCFQFVGVGGASLVLWIQDAMAAVPWLVGAWLIYAVVFVFFGLRAWRGRDARAARPLNAMAGGDLLSLGIACTMSFMAPYSPLLALIMLAIWGACAVWHIREARAVPLKPLISKLARDGLLVKASDDAIEWRGFHIWATSPSYEKSNRMQKLMNYEGPTAVAFAALVLTFGALVVGRVDVGLAFLSINFLGVALGMNEATRMIIVARRMITAIETGEIKPKL